MDVEADRNVFQHGRVLEKLDVLECSGDACLRRHMGAVAGYVFSVKPDLALRGGDSPGAEVEKGRLTGTVRSDNAKNLSLLHFHIDMVYRLQTAKIFAKPDCL